MRNLMRGALVSQDLARRDGFAKRTHHENSCSPASATFRLKRGLGETQAGYREEGGGGIRPTTNDQPRAVMRNPTRDPMRGVDLMVLGYVVGASTPPRT